MLFINLIIPKPRWAGPFVAPRGSQVKENIFASAYSPASVADVFYLHFAGNNE